MIYHTLQENDILFGRGNGVAFFPGNINFRSIAWTFRDEYSKVIKAERKVLAYKVMNVLTNLEPPSRFLEPTELGYREVSKARVLEKICQTLREKKFQPPKPEDSKRVVKSFHNLTSLKKSKQSSCVKTIVPTKAKSGKEDGKLVSAKKNVFTIERGGKNKHSLNSPGVSRSTKPKVVSPDSKVAKYLPKTDNSDALTCPIFTGEDDKHRNSSDWHLKPRVLFTEVDHEGDDDDDNDDQLDVFGRAISFLPKLELAHSEKNGGALSQTLEDELFDPLFADEFYPNFDPLAIGDEHNESMSFEVPPSLVSFFSDFSKKAPTCSTSPTTVLYAHDGRHLISDQEDDERITGWVEGGAFF
ncbi:hypothetical protein FisN_3Lh356 [Fistulifera solaris]|uniref:DUF6824 domain-containing protein n=1 Tax=Fistulifera solaris TaxID=1519565 RepID=A0A1Z5J852_FISSO|nr:hypothetical protein FisN_3Lh356 [Fistulifera solaris]|eukprot:GAX10160.1 hypothetical protein FisN_3Lh356 [Fistulifera solaris]